MTCTADAISVPAEHSVYQLFKDHGVPSLIATGCFTYITVIDEDPNNTFVKSNSGNVISVYQVIKRASRIQHF
jgi:hypothetical protein